MAEAREGRFTGTSGSRWVTQCDGCRHRRPGTLGCEAFDVIPAAILLGRHDHRTPYPGDGGIRYEPVG